MTDTTLEPIQHLRSVAALAVVLHHSLAKFYDPKLSQYLSIGSAGVDLFFVISGFIMWVTAAGREGTDPWNFVLRRLIRIAPLYWLITTFVLLVAAVAPALMSSASLDASHAAASYAFLAWPHPKFPEHFWPLVVPGWTLNCEMFFYAIVALSIFAKLRWRLWIVVAVLVCLAVVGIVWQPTSTLKFYTDPILVEFAIGMLIGALYQHRVDFGILVSYALVALGLGLLLGFGVHKTEVNRVLVWGLPMAVLMLGAINLKTFLPNKPFRLLGDASYSIYLTQFCTIAPIAKLMAAYSGPFDKLLGVVMVALIATGIGVLVYGWVEKPLIHKLRDLLEHRNLIGRRRLPQLAQ